MEGINLQLRQNGKASSTLMFASSRRPSVCHLNSRKGGVFPPNLRFLAAGVQAAFHQNVQYSLGLFQ